MKGHIGKILQAIAAIHTLFAVVVFANVWRQIGQAGLFDSVGEDALRGAVVWFALFGLVLFLFGQAVSVLEKSTQQSLPRRLGAGMLTLGVCGIVLMPASGFWLVLPPAMVVLAGKRQG